MSEAPKAALPPGLAHGRPKGEQLQEILEAYIASLSPGDLLPSERALSNHYGVARMTVRQEIERLAAKGIVLRMHGRGTFVAEPKFVQSARLTSFSEDMRARGMTPGSSVLERSVLPANEFVASHLEVDTDTPVVKIDRVRSADGEPMAFERAYLPSARFPGLETEDLAGRSLYELLRERWGVVVESADQIVTGVALSADEAELLGTTEHQPAFLIQRTTRDAGGLVIEYVRSLYRTDRYDIQIPLKRGDRP
jgi:GntR family transcriptional regulator